MRGRARVAAGLGAAIAVLLGPAIPAAAGSQAASFSGGVDGTAKGGTADCSTVTRADGRSRFVARNRFTVDGVGYSMQAAFFDDADTPGRHRLVPDAPPGVTVLLVRSRDGRRWASARGRIVLSADGHAVRLRATLVPAVPAGRGPAVLVRATIACTEVEELTVEPGSPSA